MKLLIALFLTVSSTFAINIRLDAGSYLVKKDSDLSLVNNAGELEFSCSWKSLFIPCDGCTSETKKKKMNVSVVSKDEKYFEIKLKKDFKLKHSGPFGSRFLGCNLNIGFQIKDSEGSVLDEKVIVSDYIEKKKINYTKAFKKKLKSYGVYKTKPFFKYDYIAMNRGDVGKMMAYNLSSDVNGMDRDLENSIIIITPEFIKEIHQRPVICKAIEGSQNGEYKKDRLKMSVEFSSSDGETLTIDAHAISTYGEGSGTFHIIDPFNHELTADNLVAYAGPTYPSYLTVSKFIHEDDRNYLVKVQNSIKKLTDYFQCVKK